MTRDTEARTALAAAASLLGQAEIIDRMSRPLTLAALIGLMVGLGVDLGALLTAGLLIVALAGLIELYLALRTGYDAALLQALAKNGAPGASDPRVAGARRLIVLQAAAFVVQVAAILFGTALVTLW